MPRRTPLALNRSSRRRPGNPGAAVLRTAVLHTAGLRIASARPAALRSATGRARRPVALAGVVAGVLGLALVGAACSPVEPAGTTSPVASASRHRRRTSSVTPADPAQVKAGGTLTVALSADPDKLDPTLSRSLYSRYVFHTMCEKLYDLGPDAKVVPQLATALPTIAPDGLSLTIPLRAGREVRRRRHHRLAAVKLSIKRGLTLAGSGRKSELGPISAVETPDPNTVVIKLSKPFAPLTAALADRAGMVLSPAAVDQARRELLHRTGLRRPVQVRQPRRAELDQGGQGSPVLRRREGAPGRDRVPDHHRLEHPLGQPEVR